MREGGIMGRGKRAGVPIILLASVTTVASPVGAQEPQGPRLHLPQVLERGRRGPTLLLIPCAGCGAPSWDHFMEVNADRFRMVAVTLPGYDGSPRPELPLWSDSTVFQDDAVRRLSELIDERGLTDVVVVGQSFGSLIALRLATARADVVSAVVNVDGAPTNPVERAEQSRAERVAEARRVVDDDWAIRLQDPETYRGFNAATRQPDAAQRQLHHGMFMGSDRVSMLHYWRENLLRDRNPEFRALAAPYLDVNAIYPWDSNPDSTAAAYAAGIEGVGTPEGYQRATFWDTSHWIHLERAQELGTVILDFLEGREVRDIGPFRFDEVESLGEGPQDVVLMPCLGCDASSWSAFMDRNRQRYRMFAVTWPGFGRSRRPRIVDDPEGTPHLDYLTEALDLLIEREGLTRPVLVAPSAASVAAVCFAARRPGRVSGVVSVSGTVVSDDPLGLTTAGRLRRAGAAADVLAREWRRADAGRCLSRLKVPFLAVHGLPLGDEQRAARERTDLSSRYARATMPIGGRVVFIENGGDTPWAARLEAIDAVLADFVLGSAERTVR